MTAAKCLLSAFLTLCMLPRFLSSTTHATGGIHPFTDVKETDWFNGAVQYVYQNGLMNGTDGTLFPPDSPIIHSQLIAVCKCDSLW